MAKREREERKMANMKVMLLLFLVVSVQFYLCLGDDIIEHAKQKSLITSEDEKQLKNLEAQIKQILKEIVVEVEDKLRTLGDEKQLKNLEVQTKQKFQKLKQMLDEAEEKSGTPEDQKELKNFEAQIKQRIINVMDEVEDKLGMVLDLAKHHANRASNMAAKVKKEKAL